MEESFQKYKDVSSLFVDKNQSILFKGNNILISPGTTFLLPIRIDEEGTLLKWTFYIDTYDIDFRFGSLEGGKVHTMELDYQKYIGNGSYAASVRIEKKGYYAIEWDNTASWIREKRITYTVEEIFPTPPLDERLRVYNMINADLALQNSQLSSTMEELETQTQDQQRLLMKMSSLEYQADLVNGDLSTLSNTIHLKETELANTQSHSSDLSHQIHLMALKVICLLENSRLFSFLTSSDLISLASSNATLLPLLQKSPRWSILFERETAEQLAKATRIPWVYSNYCLHYPRIPNPRFFGWQHDVTKHFDETPTEEGVALAKKGPRIGVSYLERLGKEKTVLLSELSLIDELPNGEGWYEDKDNFCHFIRLFNDMNESGIVLYCGIPRLQWDQLIERSENSAVMIALPGTVMGESGLYLDKSHRVTKWIRCDNKWTRVAF